MAEAAKLADLQLVTLRMWFERGHFSLTESDQNAPQGGVRYLSIHTTLAVCIAAQLTRVGLPVARASIAGLTFALGLGGSPKRKHPAALYDGPRMTMIAVNSDDIRIFPVGKTSDPFEILTMIGDGAVVLPVNDIMQRIEESAEAASAMARVRAQTSRARAPTGKAG